VFSTVNEYAKRFLEFRTSGCLSSCMIFFSSGYHASNFISGHLKFVKFTDSMKFTYRSPEFIPITFHNRPFICTSKVIKNIITFNLYNHSFRSSNDKKDCLRVSYEGRLKSSWTHIITPSRSGDDLLFEVLPSASVTFLTTLNPLLENVLQTADHF
jgi:hypothetical protein